MSYELKSRDIERRFFTCEQLIQRQQRKGFLHQIVTEDEKWIFYDNPKKKKYYAKPGQSLPPTSTSTFTAEQHCVWTFEDHALYLVGPKGSCLPYYELLKPGDSITGDRYRLQLIRLSLALQENGRNTSKNIIKLFFFMTRPYVAKVVKKYLETLKWDVLPYPPYSPDIASSDYWLFRRIKQVTGSLLSQNRKLAPKLDRLQRRVIFSRWNSKIAWEMGKSNRQQWTIL